MIINVKICKNIVADIRKHPAFTGSVWPEVIAAPVLREDN
jgi:hypothetical protein